MTFNLYYDNILYNKNQVQGCIITKRFFKNSSSKDDFYEQLHKTLEENHMTFYFQTPLHSTDRGTIYLNEYYKGGKTISRKISPNSNLLKIYEILMEHPHPYLPKIYWVDSRSSSPEIQEEFIEGTALNVTPLSERQACKALIELCDVLIHIHNLGIIHRDIKPSNIMLCNDGHIRLIDFDIARIPDPTSNKDTVYLGTEGYAPPEQYGFAQTGFAADIYAFGITMEQLLGSASYQRKYRKIISKCTEFDPSKRYHTFKQVKTAIKWAILL